MTTLRFAPSPNGQLHLGHAYSALLNQQTAKYMGAKLLLRIEDIDTQRCTPALNQAMAETLHFLGFKAQGAPVQSTRFPIYKQALIQLQEQGLLYPSFLSRAQQRSLEKADSPKDPNGNTLYLGTEREWSQAKQKAEMATGKPFAWRLNMAKAIAAAPVNLTWREANIQTGTQTTQQASPAAWGDIIIARKDTPTSYHLSVCVDDAAQAISHVIRGQDLYETTSIHTLLQTLLNLPKPIYHHHPLLRDDQDQKLAKSQKSKTIAALRAEGKTLADIKAMLPPYDQEAQALANIFKRQQS